jgi:hypothetical protein
VYFFGRSRGARAPRFGDWRGDSIPLVNREEEAAEEVEMNRRNGDDCLKVRF